MRNHAAGVTDLGCEGEREREREREIEREKFVYRDSPVSKSNYGSL